MLNGEGVDPAGQPSDRLVRVSLAAGEDHHDAGAALGRSRLEPAEQFRVVGAPEFRKSETERLVASSGK